MRRFCCIAFALCFAVLAGCSSVRPGYTRVSALVRPEGRPVAFLPFLSAHPKSTLVDGIKLAELASMELRRAMPDLEVYGPSDMRDALMGGMDESRWVDIGRKAGAELLVIGHITYLECYHDKLAGSRDGVIGFKFRVWDVSGVEAKRLKRVDWQFGHPENPADKFDPSFVTMDAITFRNEVLKLGAKRISELFYDHLRKKATESRLVVRSYKD
jgi:hypothetical protein